MKYISFGCWNKGNHLREDLPLIHLLKTLNKYIDTVDFVMITGDNYYYHPDESPYEKVKQINEITDEMFLKITGGGSTDLKYEDLKLTFSVLKQIEESKQVPIYMCAGNHEWKVHKILENQKEIEMKDLQQELFGDNFIVDGILDPPIKDTDTLFYIIDTTSINDHPFEITIQDIIQKRTSNTKNICFFGHEPIISLKYSNRPENKKKNKKAKRKEWQILEKLLELFTEITSTFSDENYNYQYICADTHNYQSMEIMLSTGTPINQTVVGCGGTFDLDPLPINIEDTAIHFNNIDKGILHVQIRKAVNTHHGFCIFDTDTQSHEFIPFFNAVEGSPVSFLESPLDKRKLNSLSSTASKRSKKL